MSYVYIIFSETAGRYYIGQTDDLDLRLEQHTTGYFTKSYTSKVNDWKLVYSLECTTRKQAVNIENFIKKMKSRTFVESLINDKGISFSLLQRFKD